MLLAGRCVLRTVKASSASTAAVSAAHGSQLLSRTKRSLVLNRGMFVQKLNPLTGEADWVLVNDPGLGDEDDASADLVATSSYLDMLTDTRRNVAYNAALRRVIPAKQQQHRQQLQRSETPAAAAAASAADTVTGIAATESSAAAAADGVTGGSSSGDNSSGTQSSAITNGAAITDAPVRVLDIGTGTGLLAMMAARALGVKPTTATATAAAAAAATSGSAGAAAATAPSDAPATAPVVACEVFPPMQNLARRVVASNGLNHVIRIANKRSDEIIVGAPAPPAGTAAAAAGTGGSTAHAAAVARARARLAAAEGVAKEPDMAGRADVIVTEIFDSELLGEGMIPTMRHAVQHLLKEGGVVIPATSRVYGQLVQCPLMHHMTGLRTNTATATATAAAEGAGAGDAGSNAAAAAAAASRVLGALGELDARARGTFYGGDELYEVREMHVDLLYRQPQQSQQGQPQPSSSAAQAPAQGQQPEVLPPLLPLSEPFPVFDFDWLRPPPASGRRTTLQVPVSKDGTAHAVLLWWQLGMTPDDLELPSSTTPAGSHHASQQPQQQQLREQQQPASKAQQAHEPQEQQPQLLLLSTAPCWIGGRVEGGGDGGALEGAEQQWRDHWKQCWAQLADEAPVVRRGDTLRLSFEHDDLNIRTKMAPIATAAKAAAPPAAATAATTEASSGLAAAAGTADGEKRSAKQVLAALQAEAEAEGQQLMPLLSWLGPQALLQLGDLGRLSTFGTALQTALAEAAGDAASGSSGGAEVVVVDGSMALGLLAATLPAVSSVTLLQESNVAAGHWLKAAAARLGVAGKIRSIRSDAYFKRLAATRTAATPATAATSTSNAGASDSSSARGPAPLVLVSEPYFSEFEQLVPWAHLKFWRDYDVIRGSVAPGNSSGGRRLVSFPRRARLVAVAATLPDLWRTRCALDQIAGLDLSAANTVLGVVGADGAAGAGSRRGSGSGEGCKQQGDAATALQGGKKQDESADDDVWGDDEGEGADQAGSGGQQRQQLPILPYSIWQAGGGYEELSSRQELLSLDCEGHLDDVEGAAVLTATRGSVCHAIVLWMEYDLASNRDDGVAGGSQRLAVITAPAADGGPGASVQGVYLLRKPVELTRGSRLHVTAQFDGLDADISVDVTVLPP